MQEGGAGGGLHFYYSLALDGARQNACLHEQSST